MPHPPPIIAVFGTLNRDTTVYADGNRTENLGGLVYTLATLAALGAGGLCILPVANVGFDLFARVQAALALPGMDLSALRQVMVPNNHVHLAYRDAENREEVLAGGVPPLTLEQCERALASQAVLVNLTSGRDVELDTLHAFRARYVGPIQIDVHSLTLGIEPGGRRVLRCPERWREWAACADWLQVNETEAHLLGGARPLEEFAAEVLELGPRGVLVTLGRQGSFAAWRDGASAHQLRVESRHRPDPVFPTGCGDVFGAAFAYGLLRGAVPEQAIDFATEVASLKAGIEPLAALADLRRWGAAALARCFPDET